MKRTCWTTVSWRNCLSLVVMISIPAGSTIIYRFLCGFICVSLCQRITIKPTNMFIVSTRAQFKINIHRCWNWHLCIPDGLSIVQFSLRQFIRIVGFLTQFQWHEANVLTGSWRSCLSLEVISSIPAGSTIIHRFLCEFICVSLCQSIIIKPTNMYTASVEIDTCAFLMGCQLSNAASAFHCALCIVLFDTISVAWTNVLTGSWRSCLSLEVMSSIPVGSTIIYRFLCGFICVSLCQRMTTKPINMHIASARAQFKINTNKCWNWHLCIPDGLSVGQCSLGHIIGIVGFFTQFQCHEANMLDNWQLEELPQSGGHKFDPRRVHDNLSVPLWVNMRFPVPEHHN